MDFDTEETSQKLNNYKIPLKSIASKDLDLHKQETSSVEELFTSPLLNCESSQQDNRYSHQRNNECRKQQQQKVTKGCTSEDSDDVLKKRKLKETIQPIFFGRDSSYPPKLNNLIQPLYCELCNAQLNSAKIARIHYTSNPHDKKIMQWLAEWSIQTGEPMPKVKKLFKKGLTGLNVFHCDVCDLPLTSVQHASQHYEGKRHKKVVARKMDPTGSGYYNSEGKWVRQLTKPINDIGPNFGIGVLFKKAEEASKESETQELEQDPSKYCSVCNISVKSRDQMEMHLNGAKHTKKLKQLDQPPVSSTETILECISCPQNNDISMYRTPSGKYYCKTCNITVTESTIFKQHLSSKKHIKKLKITKEVIEQLNNKNINSATNTQG